jgi:hypothetical protein
LIVITVHIARHSSEREGIKAGESARSSICLGHDIHHSLVRQDSAMKLSENAEFSRERNATSTLDRGLVEEMSCLFGGGITRSGSSQNYWLIAKKPTMRKEAIVERGWRCHGVVPCFNGCKGQDMERRLPSRRTSGQRYRVEEAIKGAIIADPV